MLETKSTKRLKIIKTIICTLTMIMLIAAIVFLFIVDDSKKIRRLIFSIVQLLLMMGIIILPDHLKDKLGLKIPIMLETSLTIFAFCGFVLGDVFDFYKKIPVWDSILHAFSGIILAYVGFVLIDYFVKRDSINLSMGHMYICVSVVLFSLALGAIWEIGEYLVDDIFGTNNQQYMKSTRGTLYGKEDEPLLGHEALNDTMKDLMLDLAGASIVGMAEYLKEDRRKNKVKKELG
ncbi:hypothetical protein CWE04_03810 [Thomasclavelia cocleata]|uniref:Membrane-spanning protein n=1 Tax=Thomasclavelia cocleata TaxID=69824 RepID=A0A1I0C254_9FIRM|nr:hypothetical protein [Thomasclavelia cocleata]MCR1959553.1 hypothetical protein [Thomasclavelia cocleata]NDO42177.1 hypothetical protein [Thomasclavelia cocleata]PJN81214.1 hypothetical protein CWE04_03810 [Thomasclavelia cocleata]SET13490.1 hypothetical protein SAMN04489758_10240 [Thomasclavelia cocleata]